ncbi:hypothetical protein QN391_24540 [Pseudomonas sp. CCI1.2]|uniref:hypothetical protein n=1 Tax=Pseudomonas sp. CCI1.2 TaxID=3048614 RepID=UPI002B236F1E|nr:hypothetical protein [Pseudomonas sp. CCI1.2]MEB0123825.1 hypothetical protein [Pseudomonas sp. CCI1.2]
MITYEFTDEGALVFSTPNARSKKGFIELAMPFPEHLEQDDLLPLCDGMVAHCQGKADPTGQSYLLSLKRTLLYVGSESKAIPAPKSSDWFKFIVEHYIYHFSDTTTKEQHETKRGTWRMIAGFYRRLKHRNVIPKNIEIPKASLKRNGRHQPTPPLGYESTDINTITSESEPWPKSYLVDKTIGLSNEDFFDTIRQRLTTTTDAVFAGCIDYWYKMRSVHKYGQSLINQISEKDLKEVLSKNRFYNDGIHLADPKQPLGLSWFLAVINYYFTQTNMTKISYDDMMDIPFLRPIVNNHNILKRMNAKIKNVTKDSCEIKLDTNEALHRLLGFLSSRDCAAACVIIIKENPQFTSMSLQHADLLMPNGVPYIFSDAEHNKCLFGISKPRASARKVSLLPRLSVEIFNDVLECTAKAREKLRSHHRNYRKLFITATQQWIGNPGNIINNVSGRVQLSLYDAINSHFKYVNLERKTFTLSSVRATQGILEFLRTGSLHAVAQKLGNTVSTVELSYVPEWLLHRWAIRLIRVFHQKLVVISTEGEPWQLAASDFLTEDQLLAFIAKIVTQATGRDALSDMIRSRLGHHVIGEIEIFQPLAIRNLYINLSAKSLGALYAYADNYESMGNAEKCLVDPNTGLSADSMYLLAGLIKTAASYNGDDHLSWIIRTNIQGDSLAELRNTHETALVCARGYEQEIKNFRVGLRSLK